MDLRGEVAQFLTGLRARLSPEQAGVPVLGGQRRVPGLRREEVAQLAGGDMLVTHSLRADVSSGKSLIR